VSFWSELRHRLCGHGLARSPARSHCLPRPACPDWCLPILIGFVALGFPVAPVLAWALEATPEGVRRIEVAEYVESAEAAQ